MCEIAAANKVGMSLATMPYKIGLTVAIVGGCASIPLCFHLDTVMWFNENFGSSRTEAITRKSSPWRAVDSEDARVAPQLPARP